ncbi:hypothetical protein [Trichormus sp. NMC-1]|uniref:hypothetical protein n=1 Tax=Trichormus sp. NMC-1 TaxID=1853259 RepID=UPI0008DC0736|nr:hypothetical protein [Trichormus sp. NMC-1]
MQIARIGGTFWMLWESGLIIDSWRGVAIVTHGGYYSTCRCYEVQNQNLNLDTKAVLLLTPDF